RLLQLLKRDCPREQPNLRVPVRCVACPPVYDEITRKPTIRPPRGLSLFARALNALAAAAQPGEHPHSQNDKKRAPPPSLRRPGESCSQVCEFLREKALRAFPESRVGPPSTQQT